MMMMKLVKVLVIALVAGGVCAPVASQANDEALRRSMLALMETSDKPYYAHPLFWAPFVVVDEGA